MLRQLREALRYAVADFFDVSWQSVAALLALIALLAAYAFLRTFHFALSYRWPGGVLLLGVGLALFVARNYFRRR